jgi:hypothetical protein
MTGTSKGRAITRAATDRASDFADSAASAFRNPGVGGFNAFAVLGGARKSMGRMFTAQPLLLAAGGLALGAAIAASLPRTEVEARALGDTADESKRRAGAFVSRGAEAAKSTLQDAAASARGEAEKRGLSRDASKESASGMIDNAADAARSAGKEAGLI